MYDRCIKRQSIYVKKSWLKWYVQTQTSSKWSFYFIGFSIDPKRERMYLHKFAIPFKLGIKIDSWCWNSESQHNVTHIQLIQCHVCYYTCPYIEQILSSDWISKEAIHIWIYRHSARYVGVLATGKSWPPIFSSDTEGYYWWCPSLKYIRHARNI